MTLPFDDDFKNKVLALSLRDNNFCERVDGLIKPELFDNEYDKYILSLAQAHYQKYGQPPSAVSISHTYANDKKNGVVRTELQSLISSKFKQLYKTDVSDRDFVVDEISNFARRQATINAVVAASEIIDKGDDVAKIMPLMQKALDTGTSDLSTAYDYKGSIKQRTEIRKARLKGDISFNSVTTGYKEFDATLFRRGWGKAELSLYMAPSKAGKSIALIDHALRAVERGYNTLFISLEVSTEIQNDRMDSNISGVKMDDLYTYIDKVNERVEKWATRAANLKMHEYPSGTFRVSDLRRIIKRYQAQGTIFDLVVVDYTDIMLSESSSTEGIDKSKQVLIDLRALAQAENVAILSATQTNREGAKANETKEGKGLIEAIHVAEDFNKIRIADLVISINANELEKQCKEARLYFAASRNQKAVTITIKRDLAVMRHIKEIVEIKG
jgi:replicative DNA helicase